MSDVQRIRQSIAELASARKKRLFACACLRRFWVILLDQPEYYPIWLKGIDDWLPSALDRAEAHADGTISKRAMCSVWNGHSGGPYNIARHILRSDPDETLHVLSSFEFILNEGVFTCPYPQTVAAVYAEVFGDLERSTSFEDRWRTSDVLGLALAVYDDRAADRLPILADALMDAGCDNEDILAHCRSDGPHVRGCWVVDLVLGKT